MLPPPLSHHLLLFYIYIALFFLAWFDLVVLVVKGPAAVMFQVRSWLESTSTRAPMPCDCHVLY
jgi:hypothetical protein